MLDLNSSRWSALRHAYGFAGNVPGMIRRLATNPDKKTWEDVWSSLCHQSDVYSATYAAIPYIVEIGRRQPLDKQLDYWIFVGIVAANAPTSYGAIPEDLREDYFQALRDSALQIRRVLDTRPPRTETICLLLALTAVLGGRAEARMLDQLTGDEIPVRCPACSIELQVSLDGDVILLQAADDSSNFSILPMPEGPTSMKPAEPLDPNRVSEWLPSLAALAGHPALAIQIRALYTQASCPGCHRLFELMGEICRQVIEYDLPEQESIGPSLELQNLDQLIHDSGLWHLRKGIVALTRPAIGIESHPEDPKGLRWGSSRIGGTPDLPEGMDWPAWNGAPLAFLAQIRLDDVTHLDVEQVLPKSGHLLFYFDSQQEAWGFDPADRGRSRVVYVPPVTGVRSIPFPPALAEDARFAPCSLTFSKILTLPHLDSKSADSLGLRRHPLEPAPDREKYSKLLESLRESQGKRSYVHQLLGHASPVQNEMEEECELASTGTYCGGSEAGPGSASPDGAKDWRLLFQIDSDEYASMMWGDMGVVYFWIRRQDLAARAFDRVWTILQCC